MSKGFTLLELLVVLAIIGILASIALPSYKIYTQRARFSEVILAASPYKTAVSLALQSDEKIDTLNNGENGIPNFDKPTKNVTSINVQHGVITATASKAAGSYTYVLTPDADGIHWQVSGSCVAAGFCKG